MNRIKIITVILLNVFFVIKAQVNTFNEQYIHEFDGTAKNGNNSIAQMNDRGYVISRGINTGSTSTSFYNGVYELLRTNREGKPLWSKQIFKGYNTSPKATFNSLLRNPDNSLLLGTTESNLGNPRNIILVKMDSSANLVWSKQYTGEGAAFVLNFKKTIDGGYIVCGYTSNGAISYPYVFKIDSVGNYVWGKKSTNGIDSVGIFYSVTELPGNNYVACGFTGKNALITKIDANGNLVWDKMIPNSRGVFETSINTIDNSILSGGFYTDSITSRYRMWILKTDVNGNIIWQKGYTQQPPIYNGSNMLYFNETNTGRILYSAYIADPIPGTLLGKLDLNGNIIWNSKYRFTFNTFNYEFSSVIKASDGGLAFSALVGTITGSMSTHSTEFLKTDSLGNVGCEGVTYSLSLSNLNFVSSSGVILTNSGTGINYTPTLTTTMFTNTVICENIQDSASAVGINELKRNGFNLYQNMPNPFTYETRISYYLNDAAKQVSLEVFDLLGKKVFEDGNLNRGPGLNNLVFVNEKLKAGLYFYKLEVDGETIVSKMIIE